MVDAPGAARTARGALYLDTADGFGEWDILLSTRAVRDLRQTRRKAPDRFRVYLKKIKELSNGQFSADNQKRLTDRAAGGVPIYEAKMTADSRLVYQVDCIPDARANSEKQTLRILGVYTHAQLDSRFWASMSHQLSRKGREYIRRCTYKTAPLHKGDYVVRPASFPDVLLENSGADEAPRTSDQVVLEDPKDLDEIHALLVLEKYVKLSQGLMDGIMSEHETTHAFAVSSLEQSIIAHPGSCYVLGRSGTGKTTTMLFKMLAIEQAWSLNPETSPKPRQVFVTQSAVLASKVEEYYLQLSRPAQDESRSPTTALLGEEEDKFDRRRDLPATFSGLEDCHFPLFISFHRLCAMLEADIDLSSGDASISSVVAPRQGSDRPPITYEGFLGWYNGHFFMTLDPALVFSEILGVIKGSEKSLKFQNGHLDRETYLTLSHRTNPTFITRREAIWEIFLAYTKKNEELGHRDGADRTRAVLNHWKTTCPPSQKFDFLYVDEAQDNLLIDVLVLRNLCRNPDGLFWAGDTAQTIANGGSSFRFNDLKAFLHRIESKSKHVKSTARCPPLTFELTVNYRSHGGIVNCASAVIRVIAGLYPHSIDALQEERGIVDGAKPTFFEGGIDGDTSYLFFGRRTGERVEFGADQCILVRDDAARDRLQTQVGDIGLIMTLYESKGLEFNDVILYDFFRDSTVESARWRVVLHMLPEQYRDQTPTPRFDEALHAGVCAELKFLYVAITRARRNLWIFDQSAQREPIQMLLAAHNLIEIKSIDESSPRLAQPSTPLQWEERGRALFRNKNYTQAVLCFERARRPDLLAPARAYELQASALQLPSGSRDAYFKRAEALGLAELAFSSCSSATDDVYSRRAAECRDERQLNLDAAYAISSLRSQGKQVSANSSHVVEKLQIPSPPVKPRKSADIEGFRFPFNKTTTRTPNSLPGPSRVDDSSSRYEQSNVETSFTLSTSSLAAAAPPADTSSSPSVNQEDGLQSHRLNDVGLCRCTICDRIRAAAAVDAPPPGAVFQRWLKSAGPIALLLLAVIIFMPGGDSLYTRVAAALLLTPLIQALPPLRAWKQRRAEVRHHAQLRAFIEQQFAEAVLDEYFEYLRKRERREGVHRASKQGKKKKSRR